MQRFFGIGNLTRDIELSETKTGTKYVRNNLAIRRDFKNANGEYDTDFIDITLWRGQAEYAAQYLNKGNKVAISGRIQTGSYEGENGRVHTVEVVVDSIENLTPRDKETKKEEPKVDPFEQFADIVENDNSDFDLPF